MEKPQTNSTEESKSFYQEHAEISQQIDDLSSHADEKEALYLETKAELDHAFELERKNKGLRALNPLKEKTKSRGWIAITAMMENDRRRDYSHAWDGLMGKGRDYDKNIASAKEHVEANLEDYIEEAREDAAKDGVDIK